MVLRKVLLAHVAVNRLTNEEGQREMDREDPGGGASQTTEPAAGTSSATDVSLREHLASLLGLNVRRLDGDVRATRWAIGATVLFGAFAWSEIQRRLEILNHENARLLQQQERTVSQDTYSANEQQRRDEAHDLNDWRKEVDRTLTQSVSREELSRETKVDRRASGSYGWQIAAVGLSVLFLLLGLYAAYHSGHAPVNVTVTTPNAP